MTETRNISFAEAIRDGLAAAMIKDQSVFLMGEGVADPGSFFGTTKGIDEELGADRVIEMPVSENAMTGVAVGAAMYGQRPVISLHRVEFALLALEQIVNNAAKMHYVSNGNHQVPLVIRMIVGRGWGQGPEHSQSLESIFSVVPGLKVVMPTFPADAKGMIIASVAENSPVISIEHRWLHYAMGDVPDGYYEAPLDTPLVVHEGKDITIVATSYMTLEAFRAAQALAVAGCSVEVIDLRVLRPLNIKPIAASVKKTGRLITIDTGGVIYGIGSEIIAQVVTGHFNTLKSPPVRLGLPDHPTPSSRGMIPGFYPNAISIVQKIGEILKLDESLVSSVTKQLDIERDGLAIDQPDPFFKGPF